MRFNCLFAISVSVYDAKIGKFSIISYVTILLFTLKKNFNEIYSPIQFYKNKERDKGSNDMDEESKGEE